MAKLLRHYEDSVFIPVPPSELFTYVDNHRNFSSHMNKSSWMMGGGSMITEIDEGKGQKVDSHIRMNGKVFGIKLFLEEIVTQHESPYKKAWETVGSIRLLVIGHYEMGLEIKPQNQGASLKVFINYELPESNTRWLGYLFGRMYAKWCVGQMIKGARDHFATKKI